MISTVFLILHYREVQTDLHKQAMERCSDRLLTEYIRADMAPLITEVATEVFRTDVTERLAELQRNEKRTELLVTRRYYHRWQKSHR